MKCPFLELGYYMKGPGLDTLDSECLSEECEWWIEELKACSMRAAAAHLVGAVAVLDEIEADLCLNKYRYRCHECGTTLELKASGGSKTPVSWTRTEEVDGKHTWRCDLCSPQAQDEGVLP